MLIYRVAVTPPGSGKRTPVRRSWPLSSRISEPFGTTEGGAPERNYGGIYNTYIIYILTYIYIYLIYLYIYILVYIYVYVILIIYVENLLQVRKQRNITQERGYPQICILGPMHLYHRPTFTFLCISSMI